jgi:Uma2 family endonuclease
MALPQQFLPAISPDQYLELERGTELRHEYLDGLVYAMAGESPDHSTICFNLAGIIASQIKDRACRGFSPNMKVRAGAGGLYAYPDLMIVCGESKFHDERGDVLLNPSVIFEVLSPSTEKYDRGEKSIRYRSHIESLRDYVLVSPDRMSIEYYHREDGEWRLTETTGRDSLLTLNSIECNLLLADVYRNTKAAG